MSLFDPPFPPDPAFEQYVRERLAREGVTEIVDFGPCDDRVELVSLYGLCYCGEPYRERRRAKIWAWNDSLVLTEDTCCITGPEYQYVRFAGHVQALIEAGELRPGARLSSERELAAEYGVAYHTVRRAMVLLRERGLIATVHGRGTFVTIRDDGAE